MIWNVPRRKSSGLILNPNPELATKIWIGVVFWHLPQRKSGLILTPNPELATKIWTIAAF